MKFFSQKLTWSVALALLLALGGCSDDGGGQNSTTDAGLDAADAASDVQEDSGGQDSAATDATQDVPDVDLGILCQPCAEDSECGGDQDKCFEMPAGDKACTRSCDPAAADACPGGFRCRQVESDPDVFQCLPNDLTCENRCSGVDCADGEVCDPWTGQCTESLGTCGTGCTGDSVCKGADSTCLGMLGTAGERSCLPSCDPDPEQEASDCPTDYSCFVPPWESAKPDPKGICYPFAGTCENRCSDKDCGEGSNCDRLTGQCVESTFGYCENGCTGDAQCGDASDRCLNLGIGDGAHCYKECGEAPDSANVCPSGYQCQRLRNSTLFLCIPTGQSCDMCYNAGCGDDEICDPSTGNCLPAPEDCTKEGCEQGLLCDPVTTDCVQPGRSCEGDAWASGCDNAVTACTTRRDDTSGTCEELCNDDSDCTGTDTCVETNLHKFCLPGELSSPDYCGTLNSASQDIGTPCGSGQSSCPSAASICVEDGNLLGFCSKECADDSECAGNMACETGPDGTQICIPAQCECAITPALGADALSAWDTALGEVEVSQCDLLLDTELAAQMSELAASALADSDTQNLIEFPMSAVSALEQHRAALDTASSDATGAIEAAAGTLGASVTGSPKTYTYSGADSKLTQAVSALITQTGGTPPGDLETKAADVPAAYQDAAAPIISAVADALAARQTALQAAGWDSATRTEAFAGAPYLFLPGSSAQTGAAPDLTVAATATKYADFPIAELAQAAADRSATVEQSRGAVGDPAAWTGFL